MEHQPQDMVSVLKEMLDGSPEAFECFYDRYAPLVMQIALRILGERMEAEDCCHDIFLEVLRRGDRYEPSRGSLEAWLAVMTRSRCMDRLRKKRKLAMNREVASFTPAHEHPLPTLASNQQSPEELVVTKLQMDAVADSLVELPVTQRKAVVRAYLKQESHRQLASSWNVPLGTAKSWVRYGVNNLRKQLAKRGWYLEGRDDD
ncbi:RNA polymerase sigma factor [Paenibacillus senegalensis]|uniref:RNA polymerase sigma factor n=1 Tax=Paenibacillus senegalensis TaxID=1465766 RepID=UPI00028922F4|nr:sigma-70 family RNA polymerase sigma factor [Paenibacillus senegalensis]